MRLPGYRRDTDRAYRSHGPVCLLIGSGGMPVDAARLLLRGGFDLAGVHSPDVPLREYADAEGLPFIPAFDAFRTWAETISYDYLFSVRNLRVLPASMIDAPNICAINYHDSPLPKYAGSHATAWALANGEPTHGITWHVMTEKVDAGDLLQQVVFPVAPGTTREQLDLRCSLTAMRAFRALLPQLATETFTRTPQDLSQRTFYSLSQRPL